MRTGNSAISLSLKITGKAQRSLRLADGWSWERHNAGFNPTSLFVLENKIPKQEARGQAIVTYTENKKLGFYVPILMIEHYETGESYVDCRADYSDFRSFNVAVTVDIGR